MFLEHKVSQVFAAENPLVVHKALDSEIRTHYISSSYALLVLQLARVRIGHLFFLWPRLHLRHFLYVLNKSRLNIYKGISYETGRYYGK